VTLPTFQHPVHGPIKLGRKPARTDKRTLKLGKYLTGLWAPPENSGYAGKVPAFPMFGNDELGDCVIAAAGHLIQDWTANAESLCTPSENQILAAYEDVSGYVAGDPSTDNGCVMLDALKYWRNTGIGGHKIDAFVSVDITNQAEVKQAIWLFGGCFVGLNLPITAQQTFPGINGCPVWDVPQDTTGDGAPGSWGGHCVPLVAYGVDQQNHAGTQLVTWATIYDATWRFLKLYGSEAWAILSKDFIAANGVAPSGFHYQQLFTDLSQIT